MSDKVSGCPFGAGKPSVYGASDLTYNDYLKVPELLALQVPQSQPAHHDEMLFIVIHQAYELWFKLILHEMEKAIDHMAEANVLRAHHFMVRCNQIMKLLVQQIHILETMTPAEFLQFRSRLAPASGFQSTQFREIEFLAGLKDVSYFKHFQSRPEFIAKLDQRMKGVDLRMAFYSMLRKMGYAIPEGAAEGELTASDEAKSKVIAAIRPIYQKPAEFSQLYILSESLVEFDECLALWREHHVRVVERVIGFKPGTGGSSGVEYLRSTVTKKCFPCLWAVRTYLE
jgi:tryptophan 2,3-dioxygenase